MRRSGLMPGELDDAVDGDGAGRNEHKVRPERRCRRFAENDYADAHTDQAGRGTG